MYLANDTGTQKNAAPRDGPWRLAAAEAQPCTEGRTHAEISSSPRDRPTHRVRRRRARSIPAASCGTLPRSAPTRARKRRGQRGPAARSSGGLARGMGAQPQPPRPGVRHWTRRASRGAQRRGDAVDVPLRAVESGQRAARRPAGPLGRRRPGGGPLPRGRDHARRRGGRRVAPRRRDLGNRASPGALVCRAGAAVPARSTEGRQGRLCHRRCCGGAGAPRLAGPQGRALAAPAPRARRAEGGAAPATWGSVASGVRVVARSDRLGRHRDDARCWCGALADR